MREMRGKKQQWNKLFSAIKLRAANSRCWLVVIINLNEFSMTTSFRIRFFFFFFFPQLLLFLVSFALFIAAAAVVVVVFLISVRRWKKTKPKSKKFIKNMACCSTSIYHNFYACQNPSLNSTQIKCKNKKRTIFYTKSIPLNQYNDDFIAYTRVSANWLYACACTSFVKECVVRLRTTYTHTPDNNVMFVILFHHLLLAASARF